MQDLIFKLCAVYAQTGSSQIFSRLVVVLCVDGKSSSETLLYPSAVKLIFKVGIEAAIVECAVLDLLNVYETACNKNDA